ncbi:hypothetical protein GQX74_009099 [Glossina fuscipes]|nr:hypothetical protein GQX74_009099 [Glossina fuscipes]
MDEPAVECRDCISFSFDAAPILVISVIFSKALVASFGDIFAEASAKSPDDGGDVVCRELADCGGSSAAAAAGANVAGNGRPTGGVFGVGVCADVLLLSLPEQCDSLDGHRPSGAFETELLDSQFNPFAYRKHGLLNIPTKRV